MQTHREYFYHFIWATRNRQPFITGMTEQKLHDYIRGKCAEMQVHLYAVNGTSDHIHLACSLPTTLSIAVFMKTVKGASAHFVNHLPNVRGVIGECLYWQPGYGGMTYAARDLPRLIRYIDNQKSHHDKGILLDRLERIPQEQFSVPQGLSFAGE